MGFSNISWYKLPGRVEFDHLKCFHTKMAAISKTVRLASVLPEVGYNAKEIST